MTPVPREIEPALRRAVRLEWWTLGWQASIVAVMAGVLGSSAAMKSAWIEDMLGLVPAAVFLVAVHFERKGSSRLFPFGFARVNSLAFLVSAAALVGMGTYLAIDSTLKLIAMEHPPIGPITLFGQHVWLGWLMVGALIYSVIPPVILGRMKAPIARELQDKVLHTDALMQKADWMTGLAGVFGVLGVGFGLWWADALAALVIALDIAHDGLKALRTATSELLDGEPRALDDDTPAEDAEQLRAHLQRLYPGATVRLRESGRYIFAVIACAFPPPEPPGLRALWPPGTPRPWRLAEVSFELKKES